MAQNINKAIQSIIIGVGACGGNIVDAALASNEDEKNALFKEGVIVNSSTEDILATKLVPAQNKVLFNTKFGGAAKDRSEIKVQLKKELDVLLATLDNLHELNPKSADIIFIAGSAGGGTGSGVIPILSKILVRRYPNIIVIPIIALPADYEKAIVQQNALDCVRELVEGSYPMIIIDNNKTDSENIEERYDNLNNETVQNIRRMLQFKKVSRIGNIDMADRMAMLKDNGVLVIGSSNIDIESESPLLDGITKAIEMSPMQADITGNVRKVMTQFECDPSTYKIQNIRAAQDKFRGLAGVFEGYYAPDDANSNRVLVAFSGAKFSEKWIRSRETMVADAFRVEEDVKMNISKGNSDLKRAWTGSSGVKENVIEQNYDDLFDEVE